jgi:hypothetical protein
LRKLFTFTLVLCLLWLIPAGSILSHDNSGGAIAGRYTLLHFAALVVYGLALIVPVALAGLGGPRMQERLFRPMVWLRERPAPLVFLLVFSAVEIWYLVPRVLFSLHILTDARVTLIRIAAALLALYAVGVLVLANRTPAELKCMAVRTLIDLIAIAVAFIAVSFFYTLVIRWDDYYPRHRQWGVFMRPDPVLGYVPRPNQEDFQLYFKEEERYFSISTDSAGFRNTEYVPSAPVAGIGDSILFGWAVSDGEVWSVPLSRELGVPVLNYGVPGFYTWQYNLVADHYARHNRHRVVFYALDVSDLFYDVEIEEDVDLLQRWQLWPWQSPINFTLRTLFSLLDGSPFSNIAGAVGAQLRNPEPPAETRVEVYPDLTVACYGAAEKLSTDVEQLVAARLDRAMALAEEIGYTPLFVLVPSKGSAYYHQLSEIMGDDARQCLGQEEVGFAFMCEVVESRGYHCYDMTEDFRTAADTAQETLYFRIDGHWTPEGHRVFAHLLAQYIKEHDLLHEAPATAAP